MKYVLWLLFLMILSSLIYGFSIKTPENMSGDKYIGLAVVGLFFVWMPLFIYHRYKKKDIKKYMITDDTFKKIKDEAETFTD